MPGTGEAWDFETLRALRGTRTRWLGSAEMARAYRLSARYFPLQQMTGWHTEQNASDTIEQDFDPTGAWLVVPQRGAVAWDDDRQQTTCRTGQAALLVTPQRRSIIAGGYSSVGVYVPRLLDKPLATSTILLLQHGHFHSLLIEAVRTLVAASQAAPGGTIAERVLTTTGALIQDLMLDALTGGDEIPSADAQAVRRALDYIAAHHAEPLTVAMIATAVGLPPRRLQAACQAAQAGTIRDILATARLEAARNALLVGQKGDTVAAIAAAAGISQFGRFAVRYRLRYGESPSATLTRARGR